jgi:hypothetical protein
MRLAMASLARLWTGTHKLNVPKTERPRPRQVGFNAR